MTTKLNCRPEGKVDMFTTYYGIDIEFVGCLIVSIDLWCSESRCLTGLGRYFEKAILQFSTGTEINHVEDEPYRF